MSPYQIMVDAIKNVLPTAWKYVPYESIGEQLPDKTAVTLKLRDVARLPEAPAGAFQLVWIVTLTSPHTSRQTADPALADALVEFLIALDTLDSRFAVQTATKTVGEDDVRLAYDITVQMNISKE